MNVNTIGKFHPSHPYGAAVRLLFWAFVGVAVATYGLGRSVRQSRRVDGVGYSGVLGGSTTLRTAYIAGVGFIGNCANCCANPHRQNLPISNADKR